MRIHEDKRGCGCAGRRGVRGHSESRGVRVHAGDAECAQHVMRSKAAFSYVIESRQVIRDDYKFLGVI